jgi:hypothetical protein
VVETGKCQHLQREVGPDVPQGREALSHVYFLLLKPDGKIRKRISGDFGARSAEFAQSSPKMQ